MGTQQEPAQKKRQGKPGAATNKRRKEQKMAGEESQSATAAVADFGAVHEPQILVLSALDPKSLCSVAGSSSNGLFAQAVRSDELWATCLERAFGLVGEAARQGPNGEKAKTRCESFRQLFETVKDMGLSSLLSQPLGQPFCSSHIASWASIHRSLKHQGSEIPQTLRPPATQEALSALEAFFAECSPNQGTLHAAVRGLWSFHDGQKVPRQFCRQMLDMAPLGADGEEEMGRFQGLFGGYQVYDFASSQWFLPILAAVELTKILRRQSTFRAEHPTKVIFSFGHYGGRAMSLKFTMVDMLDGSVVAGCNNRSPSDFLPAVPSARTESDAGIVRWLAEYSRRLEDGTYIERVLVPTEPEATRGISLFPTKGPDHSVAVTRGVEVSSSSLFAPELSVRGWAYSIALRLVGTKEERGFDTCQLKTRTWNIEFEGERPDRINGEGVIGLFPILKDGGWICDEESDPHSQYNMESELDGEFRYQSCSQPAPSMKGRFGGSILMVPGRCSKPTGAPFEATVAPFRLCIPDYIF